MGNKEGYTVTYHRLVPSDIEKLEPFWRREILAAIEHKLQIKPELFGKPLRHTLKGCRTLRVGDYRAIYRIDQAIVQIVAIVHRSSNYKGLELRV